MIRLAFLFLFVVQTAFAQAPAQTPPPRPTAEELAFSRLPTDVQAMLGGLTPAQAMQAVGQANQHLIALGIPNPTPEQFRYTLNNVVRSSAYASSYGTASPFGSVGSASAGATTFPPLSPLVAPPPPPLPQR